MIEQMGGQVSLFAQDTWSGKMSQERSAATTEKTLPQSSKKRSKSPSRKPPLCLYLKRDGPQAVASWVTDGALLGEYSTHSFGECPKDGVESRLSQILEAEPHQKYCLSEKACQGILNRAERRGKELPPELKKALEIQSCACRETESTAPIPQIVRECGDIVPTTGGNQVPLVAFGIGNGQVNGAATMALEVSQTLDTMHDAQAVFCCAAVDCRNGTENPEINGTLQAKSTGGSSLNLQNVCRVNKTVRRLTPLECERLQGFPDGWTGIGEWVDSKGKKRQTTDSGRYKALGNSIALPPWKWVLKRLCAQYERDATMASLFDGIGGFPLIWEQLNGKGSCLWASEIEEFPIAVTKYHFGGESHE